MIERIPEGKNVKLFVLDASCMSQNRLLSCLHFESLNRHLEMKEAVNDYGYMLYDKKGYKPVKDELIMVKADDRWQRAVAVDLLNGAYDVILPDCSVNKRVEIANIRKLPRRFCTPFLAQLCVVDNLYDGNIDLACEKIRPHRQVTAEVTWNENRECNFLKFDFL